MMGKYAHIFLALKIKITSILKREKICLKTLCFFLSKFIGMNIYLRNSWPRSSLSYWQCSPGLLASAGTDRPELGMHLFYLRVRVFLRRPSRLVHVRFSTRLQFHLRRQLVREIFGVHRLVLKIFRVNYSSAGMCTEVQLFLGNREILRCRSDLSRRIIYLKHFSCLNYFFASLTRN